MDTVTTKIFEWYDGAMGGTWDWFNGLTREEWILVLGVAAAGGFMCMRGFGSRSNF
jgi:hypothetical protein